MARTQTRSIKHIGTGTTMGLSTPSLITFLISFVVAMAVMFAKYFGAAIPGLTSEGMQFAGMVIAYLLLVMGCLVRTL
ncbi:MAG: hypothetical protein ACR2PI_03950 [Hyphomicrobiaceae bacterium]